MNLEDLGYDDFFESGRKETGLDSFAVARVVAEHRELYRVTDGNREYSARVTGKQMFEASSREEYPAVGDWVAVTVLDTEQAVIRGVLPRKTVLKRKVAGGSEAQIIAANVDVAFIVQAVGRDFSVNRFERYAAMITAGGVRPGIILNKSDLISTSELQTLVFGIQKRLPQVDVLTTSVVTEGGLDDLKAHLDKGKTYCFIGSSGVGKSSIINELFGEQVLAIREISSQTKRGKHATTARALFVLGGGAMVIDNPGMRELGVLDSESGIEKIFDEIVEIAKSCKFSDCTHTSEPDCAVRSAIQSGMLNEKQYESYAKLKSENEFHDMTNLEKRRKDRAFGKFVKRVKEQIEKFK